jgi:exo-beta-1,3-glucanase (GH17 family)
MNARIQERAEVRINRGTDREYLLPDQLRFERRAEMVRQLLADSIPVGLVVRFIAFIIVPHRAGMTADKVRDGNGGLHAAFLMEWLGTGGIIVIAGCGSADQNNLRVRRKVSVSIDPNLVELRDKSKHNVYRLKKNGITMKPAKGIILCTIFLAALCIPYCTASDAAVIGLNGTCFSPYIDGQNANWNSPVTEKQIQNRLMIIADHTQWIRTFGCNDYLKPTGRIAHTLGVKTAIGAWIGEDPAENEKQISNLITIAKAGDVDIAVVGNERILYYEKGWSTRPDETELISFITRVKQEIPSINVTTAEPYGVWQNHPKLINEVDVLFVNIYPFHEEPPIHIDNAIQFTEKKYNLVRDLAGSKPVIISEMGWPSAGNANGAAVPSMRNATYYFINITKWAKENNIQYFYFEAFDEKWKSLDDSGAYRPDWAYQSHWGIWNSVGMQKLPVVNPKVKDRIGIYKDGRWHLDYSGNGVWDGGVIDRQYWFGTSGYIPVTGDWNNDGKDEIGTFVNGVWRLDYSGNGVWDGNVIDRLHWFGSTGYIPVTGDWNNDGKDEIGTFVNGVWRLDYNGNGRWNGGTIDRLCPFGSRGDITVTGDWNNDRKDKIGTYNNGVWRLDYNRNGVWDGNVTDRQYSFGSTGYIPVTGDWNNDC